MLDKPFRLDSSELGLAFGKESVTIYPPPNPSQISCTVAGARLLSSRCLTVLTNNPDKVTHKEAELAQNLATPVG